jgi:hypothetical protein
MDPGVGGGGTEQVLSLLMASWKQHTVGSTERAYV